MDTKRNHVAFAASAAALGANVHLQDVPGYWPRIHPEDGCLLFIDAMKEVLPEDKVKYSPTAWGTGCSDMGDVGAVMPALHPHIGGAVGNAHGSEYYITDPDLACVKSAAIQLVFLVMALRNGGEKAKSVIENYKPAFASMQEYFDFVDKLALDCDAVTYNGQYEASLTFGQ